jgi:hypothetical protein
MDENLNAEKWESGWNSPELPGRVFESKPKLVALLRKNAQSSEFKADNVAKQELGWIKSYAEFIVDGKLTAMDEIVGQARRIVASADTALKWLEENESKDSTEDGEQYVDLEGNIRRRRRDEPKPIGEQYVDLEGNIRRRGEPI